MKASKSHNNSRNNTNTTNLEQSKKIKRTDTPHKSVQCGECPKELQGNKELEVHKKTYHTLQGVNKVKKIKILCSPLPTKRIEVVKAAKVKKKMLLENVTLDAIEYNPETENISMGINHDSLGFDFKEEIPENISNPEGEGEAQETKLITGKQDEVKKNETPIDVQRLLTCIKLEFVFRTKKGIDRHPRGFWCEVWGECFPSCNVTDFHFHRDSHEENIEKHVQYCCSECDHENKSKNVLKTH